MRLLQVASTITSESVSFSVALASPSPTSAKSRWPPASRVRRSSCQCVVAVAYGASAAIEAAISFRNKPSVAVDALLKCSRRWQLVNDAIPCNKKSGFSTVQCTGLIVREPRRVVRCGGESTHIAVQLTNDDVRRPAEWRWRRPACSCFGAALPLANGSTPSRFQRVSAPLFHMGRNPIPS